MQVSFISEVEVRIAIRLKGQLLLIARCDSACVAASSGMNLELLTKGQVGV